MIDENGSTAIMHALSALKFLNFVMKLPIANTSIPQHREKLTLKEGADRPAALNSREGRERREENCCCWW